MVHCSAYNLILLQFWNWAATIVLIIFGIYEKIKARIFKRF